MTDSPAGAGTRPPTPIAEYGLIGDTRTAALAGGDGAIDWFCVPRFDGQPLFGRLVGGPSAGTFRLGPARSSRGGTGGTPPPWRPPGRWAGVGSP